MKQGDESTRRLLQQYREAGRISAKERNLWLQERWKELASNQDWSGWA